MPLVPSLPRTRLSYVWSRLRRRIWFRMGLISLAALLLVGLSALASRYVAFDVAIDVGQDAVGTILEIIASSMLAVTTFSLTAMVTAYGSATQLGTPRATQLLIGDTTSQNALSTFLGAFVFSVVGIIGLQTQIYGEQGRIVLFAGTVLLLVIVVATLLRWIAHLMTFGRMSDVIDRVEDAAGDGMRAYAADPLGGALPAIPVPPGARPVFLRETGYVGHVDLKELKRISRKQGIPIHVAVRPGALVHPNRAVVFVEGPLDEDEASRLRGAFSIERHRSFDHDPRLGLVALSEIGSRALAPATNDPGTAIEVMNAMLRVLLLLPDDAAPRRDDPDGDDDGAARVHLPLLCADDLLEDAFAPLIREGGKEAEVAIRMTKTLAAIRDGVPHAAHRAGEMADALARNVREGGAPAFEQARFARAHAALWPVPSEE